MSFLANALCYVPIQSLSKFTGTVIATKDVSTGMVIPKNLSTRNDISLSITSLKTYITGIVHCIFGAIPVKYICGYGDPAFAALVPVMSPLKITAPVWVALPVP